MQRDSNYGAEYHRHMCSMKEKNYIERVPTDELDSQERWYLPHHGVANSNKKSELRIVFDGSARQNGISINDLLMKGPDLTN